MATHAHSTRPASPRLSRGRRFVHIATLLEPRDEDPPYTPQPWHVVSAVRPDTAHVRAFRFLDAAGEMLAVLALIPGGMVLVGLASLVGGGA